MAVACQCDHWQLLVNAIILVVVFFQARSCIGAGTIINMVFVGYIADFICYVANDVVQIQMNLPLRILALLLAQLMASMGVALYMVADMGIAPYDSVAIIIEKLTHQKIPLIYRMEFWNVAAACQCNHSCSCILSGKILHWCGNHYQYGICRIYCRFYLLCSK
ncbi:uncharacterized protein BN628_01759 [Ligilactobacillus ruminis CAG:367]|nr:uncharacterized protein BN628_01759 [Ligilactobacillus ruminis CAG:367]